MEITTANGTNRDKQGKSFVESPKRGSNFTAQEVVIGNSDEMAFGSILNGIVYDTVTFSYPDAVTEIIRYYNGGVSGQLVATITAIFETHSKKNLLSLVRT